MILLYDFGNIIVNEQAMPSAFRMFVMLDEMTLKRPPCRWLDLADGSDLYQGIDGISNAAMGMFGFADRTREGLLGAIGPSRAPGN